MLPLERIDSLVVHHTGREIDHPRFIRARHVFFRGWEDTGYHYIIGNGIFTEDGKLYTGRSSLYQGAHVAGFNEHSLSIALMGDLNRRAPSPRQYATLLEFLHEKQEELNLPANAIKGHSEFPGVTKNCPGRYVDMHRIRASLQKANVFSNA